MEYTFDLVSLSCRLGIEVCDWAILSNVSGNKESCKVVTSSKVEVSTEVIGNWLNMSAMKLSFPGQYTKEY
jgi:hypothetical protein